MSVCPGKKGEVSKRFRGASAPPLVSQELTGASVLVGHVDVNVRGEGQHGADDIITALPSGPHKGRPPLQIRFILHRWVGQKNTNCLLLTRGQTVTFSLIFIKELWTNYTVGRRII